MRFVAGLGAGIVISISFTFLGLTKNTERNLALDLVLILTYGALGLWAMPSIIGSVGLSGIFVAWAVINIIALVTVKFVPRSSDVATEASPDTAQVPWIFMGIAFSSVLTLQHGYWRRLGEFVFDRNGSKAG